MLTIRQANTNNFFVTTLERKFLVKFCQENKLECKRQPIDSEECQKDVFTGVYACYGIDKIKAYVIDVCEGVWLEAK